MHASISLCLAAVGSTCVGRPRLRAPACPLATAAGLDSSAQPCGSLMQLSTRRDSTSAPTRTWKLKRAKLQQPPMCLSRVELFLSLFAMSWLDFVMDTATKLETESTLLSCNILNAGISCCPMPVTVVMYSDYKVPFVPLEKEHEVVFIREGERVVIPCRGSVEDLNVTLHTVRNSSFCSAWIITETKMWKEQNFLVCVQSAQQTLTVISRNVHVNIFKVRH